MSDKKGHGNYGFLKWLILFGAIMEMITWPFRKVLARSKKHG